MRTRREKDFFSMFDDKTGKYIRSGILKNGKDTGIDPFMASFPELLDIGIMGHCMHGRSGLCIKAGVECYQGGINRKDKNMSLEDFALIAGQCKNQTYQFALGGCGDPDQHEQFKEILEICRKEGIVPNFTTSGLGMTEEIAELCREYCGAVAVSWYRSEYTTRAINMLLKAGVKTNIHYVLSNNTLAEAIYHLEANDFPKNLNAVIFLLHKPVGLGTRESVIDIGNEQFGALMQMIDTKTFEHKIGFDSCTVPALVNKAENVCMESLDTCEGARWSAYISADMKMMPCSFDNQRLRWAVDLRSHSIEEAWQSSKFDDFRKQFRNACPDCDKRSLCMGGCPICPEIVLCKQKKKDMATYPPKPPHRL